VWVTSGMSVGEAAQVPVPMGWPPSVGTTVPLGAGARLAAPGAARGMAVLPTASQYTASALQHASLQVDQGKARSAVGEWFALFYSASAETRTACYA